MFFYNKKGGGNIKIYVDLVFILNFFFDFLLLLSVSILLRRHASIYRIILGAFIGSLSLIALFFPFSTISLFFFKIIISILMLYCSFGYHNIRYMAKNFLFLYMASIILGGFLYFLNIQFSYQQKGFIFIYHGLSINVIFLIIFCPVILYIYIKQAQYLKIQYHHYYLVNIFLQGKKYLFHAFFDTGNQLYDCYSRKPIILIDQDIHPEKYFYVPYKGVNQEGVLKCFKSDHIEVQGKYFHHVVVGILENKIKMDGVDCLLHERIVEKL